MHKAWCHAVIPWLPGRTGTLSGYVTTEYYEQKVNFEKPLAIGGEVYYNMVSGEKWCEVWNFGAI